MKDIPADTSKEAYLKEIELIRKMSPEQRAARAFDLTDSMRENAIAGIKSEHPEYTREQIRNELLRRLVGERMYAEIARAKGLD
jgi:hypothetical protein